ncbi:MAG TPA: MMPL family transporter [Nevskiales bacterium]|nr:MMPL family transporter [Nevskiales bacterium]
MNATRLSRYEQAVVRYTEWLLRHRWLVLLLSLLLIGGLTAGVKNLKFSTDYRVYFGKDNPQLLAFDEVQNVYSKNDNILLMFEPKVGDIFQPRFLEAVRAFTEDAWKLPYASRVDSIANYQHTEANGDDLRVQPLIGPDAELTPERLAWMRQIVLKEPLLVGRMVSPTGHVTGININFTFPPVEQQTQKELPAAVAATRALRDRYLAEYPEIGGIYMTGSNMMSNAFTEASRADIQTLVPLMYAVIVLVMALLLRSGWATLATMAVVVISAVAAMGVAGWMHILLTPPSAAAPQIITTLAVADCVHIYTTTFALMRAGRSKAEAIVESMRVNFTAVFLTSATTAVGFLSVNFTDSPPLKDLANIAAIGVMLAWFFAIFTLPAMMALLPARVPKARDTENSRLTRAMDGIADFVIRHRNPVFYGTLAITLAFSALAFKNEGNDLFVHYFEPSIKFRTDSDHVSENLTGLYSMEFSLRCGTSECVSDPEYLRKLDAFAQWWRSQDKVLHVFTVSDIYKRLNKNMHGDDPAYYRLPEQSDLSAQYLLLYELSLPFGLDLTNTINQDKSATRFMVFFKHLKSKETRAVEEQAVQWLRENAPELETHGVSPAVMFAHISKRNLESNFTSLPVSLAIISLLLLPVLRSWRLMPAFLLPNLLPLGVGFGVWALISGEVNFTMAIVLNMTVGIIVDDTIHFMTKYLRARREEGMAPEAAVRYAFHNVGVALLVTTLILVAGFSILAQSAFLPNSGMSILTAITVSVALLIDLLLLPAMLLKIDRVRAPAAETLPVSQEMSHEVLASK